MHFHNLFPDEHPHHHDCCHKPPVCEKPVKPECPAHNRPPHRPKPEKPVKANDYHYYDYSDTSHLVSYREQAKRYFDRKFNEVGGVDHHSIEHTIHRSLEGFHRDFHHSLDTMEHNIISEVQMIPTAETLTKQDLQDAVNSVNSRVDEKFNEIDFEAKFSDLNEMISNINN